MQSAAPHVLAVLDRTHTPGRAVDAAREARVAGIGHVNLDLIYGTPGETDSDVDASIDAVLSAGVDHVSAYALIVEDGTALARRIRRGEIPPPTTTSSRSATSVSTRGSPRRVWVGTRCRTGRPAMRPAAGTTSATGQAATGGGRTRCTQPRRRGSLVERQAPGALRSALADGALPVQDSEVLTDGERHMETVMLTTRLGPDCRWTCSTPGARQRRRNCRRRSAAPNADHLVLTDRVRCSRTA